MSSLATLARRWRHWLPRALLLTLGAASLPVPAHTAESQALRVMQAADLTGLGADFGRDYTTGAKVYFDYVNGNGGINGRRIVYRYKDSGGSPQRSVAEARDFLRDGADVLFGFTGDDTVAALARDSGIRAAGVPLFAPVAGASPAGPKEGVYFLRSDLGQEIRALVSHLTTVGVKSFGVAATDDDYGRNAVRLLEGELKAHQARLLGRAHMSLQGDGPDRAAQELLRSRPQAVLVLADTLAVAQFVKRYRAADPGAFLCAPSQVNVRTLISIVGPQTARGLIVTQVVPDPHAILPVTREHMKLMGIYTDEPVSQATLEGFLAAKALVQSLRRTRDLSHSGIQQALRESGRLDLGGFNLNFGKSPRPSNFVEVTVVSRNGQLLR